MLCQVQRVAQRLTGIAAFTFAALVYEMVHYASHVPVAPWSAYLKSVRRHHTLHHFKNERYWHGFTVPLVDVAFGTAPDHTQVPISDDVRTLGVDDELGTITEGKLADLVVVDGDPLDVSKIQQNIVGVYKGGELVSEGG